MGTNVGVHAALICLLYACDWTRCTADSAQACSTGTIQQRIDCKYSTADQNSLMRAAFPRYGGNMAFEVSLNYAIGVASTAAAGILLMFITFVAMWIVIGRQCCCPSKVRTPEADESVSTKTCLIVSYASAVVIVAFAIVGVVYTFQMSSTMVGGSGSVATAALSLIDDARSLDHAFNDTLASIQTQVPQVVSEFDQLLSGGVALVRAGTGPLVDHMQTFDTAYSNWTVLYNGTQYRCLFCTTLHARMQQIIQQIHSQADSTFSQMLSTVQSINSTVLSVQSTIHDNINSAESALKSVDDTLKSTRSTVSDVVDQARHYDGIRNPVVVVLFLLPIVACVVLVAGHWWRNAPAFTCIWVSLFLLMTLLWLLFAVHVPLAIGLGDACVYLNHKQRDVDTLISSSNATKTAQAVNACLFNTSLIDALQLTNDLNFSNQIVFPTLPLVNDSFTFTQLFALQHNISSLTLHTFQPFPTSLAAQNVLSADLQALQHNATRLSNEAHALVSAALAFQLRFNTMHTLLQPFIDDGRHVYSIAYCGFVGDTYHQVKSDLCVDLVNELSYLSMAFFFVSLGCFVLIIPSIYLVYRFRPLSTAAEDEDATDSTETQRLMKPTHVSSLYYDAPPEIQEDE